MVPKNTEMEGNWQISGNFPPFLCFLGPFGGITNQCTTKLMFGMKASFMVTTNNLYSACQNSKKVFFFEPPYATVLSPPQLLLSLLPSSRWREEFPRDSFTGIVQLGEPLPLGQVTVESWQILGLVGQSTWITL